jgi:hypothetical protein
VPETLTPAEQTAHIALRLRRGGSTDLRAARDHVWIIGRAPSGLVFQLFNWPARGYCVTRRFADDQATEQLGTFPTWTEAVAHALQA